MLNIRNEFILPPIKLGYSERAGIVTQKHPYCYGERNKEIAAITPEPISMDTGLRKTAYNY